MMYSVQNEILVQNHPNTDRVTPLGINVCTTQRCTPFFKGEKPAQCREQSICIDTCMQHTSMSSITL